MTPQEKAENLINQFSPHAKDWDCFHDIPLDKNHAKECALIAVDEILFMGIMSDSGDWKMAKLYWQEVKKEIEKL